MADDDEDDSEPPQLVEAPLGPGFAVASLRDASGGEGRVVPVTIITGYLGSGKSTLLNFLLKANHGKRLAIIENEFSAGLGIEGMIAKSGVDDSNLGSFFELNNGCLCCTVKGDLLVTLEQLVLHKDRFDHIIIETTGVANPGPVISTFWTDESLGSSLKLDGVVCVVDSSNLDFYLQASDTGSDVRMQISYADRILLNKSDLVSADDLGKTRQQVQSMNCMAEIRATSYASVGCDWILGIDCYSVRNPLLDTLDLPASDFCTPCGASPPPHSASTLFSCSLSFPGSIDLPKLKVFLDSILYDNGRLLQTPAHGATHDDAMRIFRMKGILQIKDEPFVHMLQAVHDIFDIQPSLVERETKRDVSGGLNHVIVIGRSLDEARVSAGLRACVS